MILLHDSNSSFFFFSLNKAVYYLTAPFNNTRTLKFKPHAAINYNYNRLLKTETDKMDQNPPITTHKHYLLTLLSYDNCGSERRKGWLSFSLQSSHVIEKRSKMSRLHLSKKGACFGLPGLTLVFSFILRHYISYGKI